MEDNKYYTPSIEEFHVGFEYEEKQAGEWTIKTIDQIYENYDLPIEDIGINLPTKFRVKYLDKEDIESLKWKDIGSLWFEKGDHKLRKWKDQSLDIYFEYADKETIMIFRGTIKNKSELKKLMEQLNIR